MQYEIKLPHVLGNDLLRERVFLWISCNFWLSLANRNQSRMLLNGVDDNNNNNSNNEIHL